MSPDARRGRRPTPRRGRAPLAGVAALLLAIATGAGLFLYGLQERLAARAAFPLAEGRIPLDGVEAAVEIFRDRSGVPHVEARSEADAFFGLGFVHAQDRLAQMSWLVRAARGRTAELVGRDGLAADRVARLLDLGGLAEAELARLDEPARELLEAYARGVNARIERIRAGQVGAPLALARAGISPAQLEDWEPEDSLAILKLYAWSLSGTLDVSLVLSDLVEHLGGYAARRFFPGGSGEDSPERDGASVTARAGAGLGGPVPDPLRRAAGLEGRSVGSSAWVVGGAHTRSGLPILVADAHLPPTAPPFFHVDHVRGGELDVAGSTIPGLPVIWSGTNQRVAWASTHARVVTTDLYVETLHPSDPTRYHDGRGWRALVERVERIRVLGGEDEILTVRSTAHGPLIQALLDEDRGALALAWPGADPEAGSSFGAFLALARSATSEELVGALETHHVPPLAVVYADRGGAFGLQVAGWIPQREYSTVLLPLPGRARWYEWRGRIPYQELPRIEPEDGRGWVVAADDTWGAAQGPRLEWLWRSGERAQRIEELLRAAAAAGPVELRELAALQSDVGASRAMALVDRAVALAGKPQTLGAEAREVAELLARWEGQVGPRSVGAAIYHVFLDRLTQKLFARELGEDLMRRYVALPQVDSTPMVFEVLDAAARGASGGWGDPAAVGEAVRESLRETWFQLSFALGPNRSRWHWGRLHPLRFAPYGPSGAGARRAGRLGPFRYGGNGSTINTAEFAAGESFDVRVASTWRLAIDAAALDEALIALAPGQSEHPRHEHFSGGLERWLEGRSRVLALSRLLVEESSPSRLALVPRSAERR